MHWYGGGMGVGAWLVMGLFWVVLIAAIIWLVVRLLPGNAPTDRGTYVAPPTTPSPLEILDLRLAHGEIDLETYKLQRAALLEARGGTR